LELTCCVAGFAEAGRFQELRQPPFFSMGSLTASMPWPIQA